MDNNCFSIECEDIILDISITPPYDVLLSCDDTPITLYASGSSSNGSHSISWLDQMGQSAITVSEPGVYTAVITDNETGCTATATSLIELIDNIPLADAGSNSTISCLEPCTQLNSTIDGNSNVLTIKWVGPNGFCSNELAPEVCIPGNYVLSVQEENGGCIVYDTVTVSEVYSNLSSSHFENLCPNDCVNFAGEEFCESGFYQVVLSSWLGCDSIVFLTVNWINVLATINTPDTITCISEQVNLNAQNSILPNGALFYWTALEGNFTEIPTTLSADVDAAGTYVLHINTQEGCQLTDTTWVIADQNEPMVNAGEDTQLDCPNQIAVINGQMDPTLTDFDLSWTGPDNFVSTQLENEVNHVGPYNLKVTNLNNGCETNDEIFVGPPDVVTVTVETEKTCWNENKGALNITLTNGGTAPYAYALDALNFQEEASFQQLTSGTYTVYWKDAKQCGGTREVTIPEIPQIETNLEETYHICTDTYTTLNAAANISELQSSVNYLWSTGATTPVLRTNEAGEYSISISNQCENILKRVEVVNDFIPAKENVYVPTAFSPNGDLVNDVFMPYLKHDLIHYEIKIFDRRGSLMFSSENPKEGWDGQIKGKDAHSGVYTWWMEYIISTCEDSRAHGFLKGDLTLLR